MDNYCCILPASTFSLSLKGAILIFRNQMNGAVKLKQIEKNHDILVLIVHRSLKFHALKMHIHIVSIIAP